MTPPPAGDRSDGRDAQQPQEPAGSDGTAGQQGRSGSNNPQQGGRGTQQGGQGAQQGGDHEGAAGWFASAALRTGIVTVGFVLFLFALGQAVGFNLLDLFIAAVTSQTGRWLVVAVFALLLIAAAGKGLNRPLTGGN